MLHAQVAASVSKPLETVAARAGGVRVGCSRPDAASALGTTERTIKAHRKQVMEKMQVRNVPELVSIAGRIGVLRGTSDDRQTA